MSGSGKPPLACIWANHANRREHEDEDLVSEPGSPELSSEDEDEMEDGNLGPNEPQFLSDDEEASLVHVEISATEQLTADFQHHAARAGMSLAPVVVHHPDSDLSFSTGAFRPGRP